MKKIIETTINKIKESVGDNYVFCDIKIFPNNPRVGMDFKIYRKNDPLQIKKRFLYVFGPNNIELQSERIIESAVKEITVEWKQ